MSTAPVALEAQSLSKAYGSTQAVSRANLCLRAGTIHALVGENGAGKSTLCRMLFGLVKPDTGQILMNGQPFTWSGPRDAMRQGLSMVHQHFMLVPSLTVAENVVLGREPTVGGVLNLERAADEVREVAERFGLQVDPQARVEDLPVGVLQRVEIIKALSGGARVLLLDEPTAVLTPPEVLSFLEVLRRLREDGRSVLLVTHKLQEVMAVADAVTIMRGGQDVGQLDIGECSPERLTELMVGRPVDLGRKPRSGKVGQERLRVEALRVVDEQGVTRVSGLDLSLHAGEVVGVAGVEGNGQRELMDVLAGTRAPSAGRITLDGRDITRHSVRQRRGLGLAHVPEDRLGQGLVPELSVLENAVLGQEGEPRFSAWGWMHSDAMRTRAACITEAFDVRPRGAHQSLASLSGGNQQKVLVGRELESGPTVLLLAQPTRGVDVGAMERIHQAIRAARDQGVAVLLISAELSEVLALSDVIHVMYRGRLVHACPGDEAEALSLGRYMMGAQA